MSDVGEIDIAKLLALRAAYIALCSSTTSSIRLCFVCVSSSGFCTFPMSSTPMRVAGPVGARVWPSNVVLFAGSSNASSNSVFNASRASFFVYSDAHTVARLS